MTVSLSGAPLTETDREFIRDLAKRLTSGKGTFDWATSPEGYDYWAKVQTALHRVASETPPPHVHKATCAECGKKVEV